MEGAYVRMYFVWAYNWQRQGGGGGGLVGSSLLYTAFHPTAVMVAYP